MRFMLQVRADHNSEAGVLPSKELVAAMGRFNSEMSKAGIMLAAEGLHSSAKGARVRFTGNGPQVVEPPFAEPRELLSGFWMIEVESRDEAIAWVKRAPFGAGAVVEVRQVFKARDFPPELLAG